jgi:type I restriction enzyme S subunit
MKQLLKKIGIKDESFELWTVRQLVSEKILEKPLDGNHGEIHPKGNDFVTEGVPFIMATDVNNGQVDYESCSFISAKQSDGLRKGFARNGDVLVTHKATIGRTAIVKYDKHPYIMLTPQVTYYRVKNQQRLNNHYLRYYFDSDLFQKTLHLYADSGSTRAYLGITEQQKLPILLPPIAKQRKIASILSAYDELIENNRRRIALLEKLAEEIYREWFVRLRFPGHEATKRIKGIPAPWHNPGILELASVRYGKNLLTEMLSDDGQYPVYGAAKVIGRYHEYNYEERTILTGCRGSVGQMSITLPKVFVTNNSFAILPHHKKSFFWLFHTLRARGLSDVIGGSAQPQITIDGIKSAKLVTPPEELRTHFFELMRPTYDAIWALDDKNTLLAKTRDLLLPRLISGKLSVEDLDIQFPPGMAEESNSDASSLQNQ